MTPEQIKKRFHIYFTKWVENPKDNRNRRDMLADFALSIADKLQREAWNAARETKIIRPTEDHDMSCTILKYQSFKQWKEKQQ